MKKSNFILSKARTVLASLACFALAGTANAQIMQMPFTPDNYWHMGGEVFNTAMIGYTPAVNDVLYASAWNGGGGVWVSDAGLGATVHVIPPTSNFMADVILGNSFSGPANNFIMAVAYTTSNTGGPNVFIDFYKINNAGSLTVTYVTTLTIPSPGGAARQAHIDVLANSSVTGITGFPFCNKFAVTWDDLNTNQVYTVRGSLNAMSLTSPTLIVGSVPSREPDVSLIHRAMASGAIDDVARYTYTDPGHTRLFYSEVDFTTLTATPSMVIDPGMMSTDIRHPRIDAYDDPTVNGNPGISQYKIVAQVQDMASTMEETRTYDNLTFPSYWTSSNVVGPLPGGYTPNYNHYVPVVAISGSNLNMAGGMNNYVVAHLTQAAPSVDVMFMEPIDNTNPWWLSTTPWPGNTFHWVNSATGTYMAAEPVTWDYLGAISICAAENQVPTSFWPALYAWSENSGGWNVFNKLVNGAYGFKQGGSTEPVNVVNEHKWSLFPNPATDNLNISNGTGTDASTSYQVTDMTGRVLLHGNMNAAVEKLDVSKIASGNYVLTMFKNNEKNGSVQFVKN